jgi:hypothetical protein
VFERNHSLIYSEKTSSSRPHVEVWLPSDTVPDPGVTIFFGNLITT